jgi:hypothetical protein
VALHDQVGQLAQALRPVVERLQRKMSRTAFFFRHFA